LASTKKNRLALDLFSGAGGFSDSYRFKRHWGLDPEPLSCEYRLVKAREMPDLNPNNPRYRLFINAWKRLSVGVSRAVGPWLARGLA